MRCAGLPVDIWDSEVQCDKQRLQRGKVARKFWAALGSSCSIISPKPDCRCCLWQLYMYEVINLSDDTDGSDLLELLDTVKN